MKFVAGLGCVSTDSYIIFAGGFDGHTRLNTVEKLRLGSTQTIQMPPMPFARLFQVFFSPFASLNVRKIMMSYRSLSQIQGSSESSQKKKERKLSES